MSTVNFIWKQRDVSQERMAAVAAAIAHALDRPGLRELLRSSVAERPLGRLVAKNTTEALEAGAWLRFSSTDREPSQIGRDTERFKEGFRLGLMPPPPTLCGFLYRVWPSAYVAPVALAIKVAARATVIQTACVECSGVRISAAPRIGFERFYRGILEDLPRIDALPPLALMCEANLAAERYLASGKAREKNQQRLKKAAAALAGAAH